MIVGAAAGKMTVSAGFVVLISRVRATLTQSARTLATPKAVLVNIGQTEQMKITKIEDDTVTLEIGSKSYIRGLKTVVSKDMTEGLGKKE